MKIMIALFLPVIGMKMSERKGHTFIVVLMERKSTYISLFWSTKVQTILTMMMVMD